MIPGCIGRNDCTDIYVYGLAVTVVGGAEAATAAGGQGGTTATEMSECAAQVVAVQGSYREELECSSDGNDCHCFGGGERKGTYTVTASLGDKTETKEVEVKGNRCHVETQAVTFFD